MTGWAYFEIDLGEMSKDLDKMDFLNQASVQGWELVGDPVAQSGPHEAPNVGHQAACSNHTNNDRCLLGQGLRRDIASAVVAAFGGVRCMPGLR